MVRDHGFIGSISVSLQSTNENLPLGTAHRSNTSPEIQIIEIDFHPPEEEPSAAEREMLSTVKSKSEGNDSVEVQTSSFKLSCGLLRENISLNMFTLS